MDPDAEVVPDPDPEDFSPPDDTSLPRSAMQNHKEDEEKTQKGSNWVCNGRSFKKNLGYEFECEKRERSEVRCRI